MVYSFTGNFPVAETVAERVVALPFYNRISDTQIDEVCAAFERLIENARPD